MKKILIKITPIFCFCIIIAIILDYAIIKTILFVLNPVNQFQVASVNVARADDEIPMKLWVLQRVWDAGLNPNEADCIITKESNWKEDAISKTNDFGLWQINIQHKNQIAVKEMFDYKKATSFAINKRLKDGNWCAWVAAKKCGEKC